MFLRAIQESLQEYQGIPSTQLVVATGSEEPSLEGRGEEEPREESDLELALRLSQEAKEEEDRRRKEEEDILQKVLQLSVEEK